MQNWGADSVRVVFVATVRHFCGGRGVCNSLICSRDAIHRVRERLSIGTQRNIPY